MLGFPEGCKGFGLVGLSDLGVLVAVRDGWSPGDLTLSSLFVAVFLVLWRGREAEKQGPAVPSDFPAAAHLTDDG